MTTLPAVALRTEGRKVLSVSGQTWVCLSVVAVKRL